MNLLVSGCNSDTRRPGLYVVDAATGIFRVLSSGGMRGLVPQGGDYLCVDHDHLYRISVEEDWVWDLGPVPNLDAAHSLFVDGAELWINNTGVNTVLVVDVVSLEPLRELSPRGKHGGDHHHINSLWIEDGDLYLSMMAWETELAGDHWQGGDGTIARFTLDGEHVETIYRGLHQPHSVTFLDGRLYWLESCSGRLYRDGEAILAVDGYARGLAADDRFYYVGTSQNRHTGGSQTGVWVVSRTDVDRRRFIPLPHSEGVYDIEVLSP